MHTRRISTFLLGAWLGCSLFMWLVVLQNLHSADLVLSAPVPPVETIVKTLGQDQLTLLLRHHAAEQTRNIYYIWEETQIALGVVLAICLYFATQKRALSLVLCGIMLALVLFQFFAIAPELAYRGRETDFPSSNASGNIVRSLLLYQLMVASEGIKFVVGGILASYLFALRASRKRIGSRREVDTIDHADHSHVDG